MQFSELFRRYIQPLPSRAYGGWHRWGLLRRALRWSLVHRMFIKECPWEQPLCKGREGTRIGQKEKSSCPRIGWAKSTGISGARMAIRIVPHWVRGAAPWYPYLERSLDVVLPGKTMSLGEAALQLRHSRRNWQVKTFCWRHTHATRVRGDGINPDHELWTEMTCHLQPEHLIVAAKFFRNLLLCNNQQFQDGSCSIGLGSRGTTVNRFLYQPIMETI